MSLPAFPTNTGFHNAPVCKSLAVLVGGLHIASNVPSLQTFFRKILQGSEHLDSIDGFLRRLGTKFFFLDTKCAVIACVVIYFFRIFERRYGSLKFATNLIISWLISVSLEIICEQYFDTRNFGPLAFIIPLYVPWYIQIPLVSASQFGPVALSSKSFNYLLGLQMALATKGTLVSTLCGLVSGLIVYCSPIKNFSLPGWVGNIFSSTIGKLVSTYPENNGALMGATLEIQRSQQAEALEEQLLRSRNRFNVPVNGGGRQMRLEEMWGGAGFGQGARFGGGALPPPVVPSPAHLQTLQDMGFSRERAQQALRQSRNNLDDATNILLNDIM